jgi:glycosyltransferase involved in cell wall biosynthesis
MKLNKFKNIKGLHIVPHIKEEASGPTYSVVRLCEELTKMGEHITLITLGSRNKNIKFHAAYKRIALFSKLGVSMLMKKDIYNLAYSKDIDYIHSHGLWEMPSIYAGYASTKYSIPLIVSPRGALSEMAMKSGSKWLKKFFWFLFQKKMLNSADYFHATSYEEYKDIRRMGFEQPVAIIPNGIGKKKYIKKQHNEFKNLLYLGRIHPIKGLENLLHAWSKVQSRFPDWNLNIAGPGSEKYMKKIKQISRNLNLNRVTFYPALYGDLKWQAYREANLYILPSYSENFGMTVVESLSVGTPVITTTGTPWRKLKSMHAGFWINNDAESIKKCLVQSMNTPSDILEEMGVNGYNWVRIEFSWEIISNQMQNTYMYLLKKNNEKPKVLRF